MGDILAHVYLETKDWAGILAPLVFQWYIEKQKSDSPRKKGSD